MENEVTKLGSAWLNIEPRLEKSEWLVENVKGLDQSVKQLLLLIEDLSDGSNHLKQHELVACMEGILHRHHLLADHYSKLAGQVHGCIQSVDEMNNCEKTTFISSLIPNKNLGMINIADQVVAPALSQSSGGGMSDTPPNGSFDSSLLSSDSDSESFNSSPNACPREHMFDTKKVEYGVHDVLLLRRISAYEKEVKISNEKLQFAEEEIAKLKLELQNNEVFKVKVDSLEAQLAYAENHIKLQEAEIEEENQRTLMLQRQIIDLEAELESEKTQILKLQGSSKRFTTELSDCNLQIKKLNTELQDASGNFALEKWQLESSVSQLSKRSDFYEAKAKELQMQCDSLADEIDKHEAGKTEMERMQQYLKTSWLEEAEYMKSEVCNKTIQLSRMNETLDELKLKYDTLEIEKDNAIAELLAANANLSTCSDHIKHLELTLQEVDCVNKQLSASSDSVNKLTAELKSKVDGLEKEVATQAAMINDIAEEKREAIRQLCFSLDHLRNSYQDLRNAYVVTRRKWC